MRLLGLELPAGQGPPCQRFAGVVDNGILLRLVRGVRVGLMDCVASCESPLAVQWVMACMLVVFCMLQPNVLHAESAYMLCVLCMLCLVMTLNLHLLQAVEKSPAELKVSDVKSMLGTWKQAFA
jgi:hypothetical protein